MSYNSALNNLLNNFTLALHSTVSIGWKFDLDCRPVAGGRCRRCRCGVLVAACILGRGGAGKGNGRVGRAGAGGGRGPAEGGGRPGEGRCSDPLLFVSLSPAWVFPTQAAQPQIQSASHRHPEPSRETQRGECLIPDKDAIEVKRTEQSH